MKMSISKTIGDILDYTNIGDNDFDVYVTYNGESVVVIGTADIIHELDYQYNDWRMYTRGTTLLGEYTYLQYCFNEYKKAMQNNLDRIYAALRQAYDPTGDYSRHETTAYKLTHEVEYGKTATNTTTDLESKTEYNSTVGDDIKTYDTVSVAELRLRRHRQEAWCTRGDGGSCHGTDHRLRRKLWREHQRRYGKGNRNG